MTILTARPNSTDVASAISLAGGQPTMSAACADDYDSSYAFATYGVFNLGFAEPVIPGGVRPVKMILRARHMAESSGVIASINLSGYGMAPVYPYGPATTVVGEVAVDNFPEALYVSAQLHTYYPPGAVRLYELYVDQVYAAQPELTVTDPTGPVTWSNLPYVAWSPSLDVDGGLQTKYRVKVFQGVPLNPDTAPVICESGWRDGATTFWQATVPLEDAVTYRAYVKIAQTINGTNWESDWEYKEFLMDLPNPAIPDIAVSADHGNARIDIDVDANVGDVSTSQIQIQSSYDGGDTWHDVRTELGGGVIDSWAAAEDVHDYDVPNGIEASYRARSIYFGTNVVSYSAWSGTVEGTWMGQDRYLKHPSKPHLNLAVTLVSPASEGITQESRQGVFQPLGDAPAVVVSDGRGPNVGRLVVHASSTDEKDDLENLINESTVPLLLQMLPTDGEPDRWMGVGSIQRVRIVDKSPFKYHTFSIEWTEVARPGGGIA